MKELEIDPNNGNNNHGHDDYHLDGFQSERTRKIVPRAHKYSNIRIIYQ